MVPQRKTEFAREDADTDLVMAIFAKCYRQGAGKDEATLVTLKQLSDPTLPSSWKMGLLDVLKLDDRSDFTESQVAAVTATLSEVGQNKHNSDVFDLSVLVDSVVFSLRNGRSSRRRFRN